MRPTELIVEGIVTTQNEQGSTAIAPMGPIVEPDFHRLIFRPFQTSTTFANLIRTRQGIFHVTDNALMLAQAAIGSLPMPQLAPCDAVDGKIIADACRWYAFRITTIDDSQPRAVLTAEVVACGHQREFLGFNRARHAVLEAAILATRVHILPAEEIRSQLDQMASWVEKTGSQSEHQAFDLLRDYLTRVWSQRRD